jgi:hypothetical protein
MWREPLLNPNPSRAHIDTGYSRACVHIYKMSALQNTSREAVHSCCLCLGVYGLGCLCCFILELFDHTEFALHSYNYLQQLCTLQHYMPTCHNPVVKCHKAGVVHQCLTGVCLCCPQSYAVYLVCIVGKHSQNCALWPASQQKPNQHHTHNSVWLSPFPQARGPPADFSSFLSMLV